MPQEQEVLTPLELAVKAAEAAKEQLEKEITADTAAGFLNPFKEGVNYEHFLKACGGKANVESYCAGKLKPEEISFLVEDLKHFKKDFSKEKEVSKNK